MLVSFSVNYRASWGESIWLNICEAGGEPRLYMMSCQDGERWVIDLELPDSTAHIEYLYELRHEEHLVSRGWGRRQHLDLSKSFSKYTLRDTWQNSPEDKTLFSSPFTQIFFRREQQHELRTKPKFRQAITIRIYAPAVRPNQELCIIGSSEALGGWDLRKALPMDGTAFPEWSITLDADKTMTTGDQYKFVVMQQGLALEWEEGENRIWKRSAFEPKEHRVYSGLHFRGGRCHWHGAGVAIPVFSLRSKSSYGIGDFTDIARMADWAATTGQRVIQILPINDTTKEFTWHDSYPYESISIFALHPLYLSLRAMGELKDGELMAEIAAEGKRLNKLPKMDYEAVGKLKWRFFKSIYKQDGHRTLSSKAFREFYAANKDWLTPYAAFCYLRDCNGTADFTKWGKNRAYSIRQVSRIVSPSFEEWDKVAIYLFLQYHLDRQLREAVEHCHSRGIALKGDIPIGVSRKSVEAWSEPHLFNLDSQAGAPPDDFAIQGQNWGFPTYNWEVMARDGFAWWRRRFEKMANYFDLYRIDHILGFFRIWEIPTHSVQGLLGHFSPSLPLSYDELTAQGLPMDRDRMLKPFIRKEFLKEIFGHYADDALKYLEDKGAGIYDLKEKYDTQRKVEKHFEGRDDEQSATLRQGLYTLANEVLFIEDHNHPGGFHPRIAAQLTKSYLWLDDGSKERFNRIYDHYYYQRHNDFWRAGAMEKLPALIDSTNMLCCAEDLGMVPDCVGSVMHQLSIITLEIQRMPKERNCLFGDTNHYPYLSVSTTSSHDISTIRGWWEEDRATTQRYYNDVMHWYGDAPSTASGQICQEIVGNHLLAPSILTILPLQDWMAIDEQIRLDDVDAERINIPSSPRHYWQYRMHLTIEDLMDAYEFNNLVREMVTSCGR